MVDFPPCFLILDDLAGAAALLFLRDLDLVVGAMVRCSGVSWVFKMKIDCDI